MDIDEIMQLDDLGPVRRQFESVMEQIDLLTLLEEELASLARSLSGNSDSQEIRRGLVRNFCTFLEGVMWTFKSLIVSPIYMREGLFDQNEMSALKETTFRIDSQGILHSSPLTIPSKVNVRFTARMLERLFDKNIGLDFSDNGWKCVQQTIDVRNRITHPKSASALFISDVEIRDTLLSINWATDSAVRVQRQFIIRLHQFAEPLMLVHASTEAWSDFLTRKQKWLSDNDSDGNASDQQ